MIQTRHTLIAALLHQRLIRFAPRRIIPPIEPVLHIIRRGFARRAGKFLRPGSLFHGAAAGGDFGADVGGEEGDEEGEFAEEGLQDGEAAAGDGEVDFEGPG